MLTSVLPADCETFSESSDGTTCTNGKCDPADGTVETDGSCVQNEGKAHFCQSTFLKYVSHVADTSHTHLFIVVVPVPITMFVQW